MHFNLTCDITKLWLYQRVKSTHPRSIGFKNIQSHKIYHFWDIRDIIKVSVKHPLSISNPAFLESLPHPASHMGHNFFLSFYLPSVLLILANVHLPWKKGAVTLMHYSWINSYIGSSSTCNNSICKQNHGRKI